MILNVSAYQFVTLTRLDDWRDLICAEAERSDLRGTVLIAEEGLNLSLAGPGQALHAFLGWLGGATPFTGLVLRESWSLQMPFRQLRVKIKPEIIRMNRPAIRPQLQRAPALDPATFARWLVAGVDDTGREVVALDTRNAFEVDHGRFAGALDWRIGKFSDFPAALSRHADELRGKTVVSYCTGGIRCEKAALVMQDEGLANVWQLDGGILGYLAQVGGTQFEGHCFVFDEREALTDTLAPVPTV